MRIVYIGNCLSKWGFTPTTVETLSERFSEFASVKKYSDKRNMGLRLMHMLYGIWVNRKNTDVLVIDTYSATAFYYAVACARLARWLNIPYVPFLHGGNLPDRLKKSPEISQVYFGNAFRLVAPSAYLYQAMLDAGYKHASIIPNYIDIDNYPFKKRTQIRPKLLWVRSFHQTYNPNLAVDLLFELKKQYPNASLCMIGPDKDGSMEKFRTYAKEKGVLEAIEITGRLDKKTWIARSQEFDIFLNTTNFDNTPVSVMEAMALGLVVVTTNAGGVPAIIEHKKDGLIFPCGDAQLGLQALNEAMLPELATQLSENARAKAETWDWQVVKKQWSALFNDIMLSKAGK